MNLLPILFAVTGLFAGNDAARTQEQSPPAAAEAAAPSAPAPDPLALVMQKHHAAGDCEDPQSDHMRDHPGVSADIGPTSVLYAVPCTQSGGRVSYRLYAHETGEIGGVRVLHFAGFTDAHGWTGTDLLADIVVDGPALEAFLPAADGSMCGHGRWTFVDYDYRLDSFATAARCDLRPLSEWTIVYPEKGS